MTGEHQDSLFPFRRLALWFWNEPRPLVRFWSALAVLLPIALLIWWAA